MVIPSKPCVGPCKDQSDIVWATPEIPMPSEITEYIQLYKII